MHNMDGRSVATLTTCLVLSVCSFAYIAFVARAYFKPSPASGIGKRSAEDDEEDERDVPIPTEFIDPISLGIMVDPVVLCATGQVYDYEPLRAWISGGHWLCPRTNTTVMDAQVSRLPWLRDRIHTWCLQHSMPLTVADTPDQQLLRDLDPSLPTILTELRSHTGARLPFAAKHLSDLLHQWQSLGEQPVGSSAPGVEVRAVAVRAGEEVPAHQLEALQQRFQEELQQQLRHLFQEVLQQAQEQAQQQQQQPPQPQQEQQQQQQQQQELLVQLEQQQQQQPQQFASQGQGLQEGQEQGQAGQHGPEGQQGSNHEAAGMASSSHSMQLQQALLVSGQHAASGQQAAMLGLMPEDQRQQQLHQGLEQQQQEYEQQGQQPQGQQQGQQEEEQQGQQEEEQQGQQEEEQQGQQEKEQQGQQEEEQQGQQEEEQQGQQEEEQQGQQEGQQEGQHQEGQEGEGQADAHSAELVQPPPPGGRPLTASAAHALVRGLALEDAVWLARYGDPYLQGLAGSILAACDSPPECAWLAACVTLPCCRMCLSPANYTSQAATRLLYNISRTGPAARQAIQQAGGVPALIRIVSTPREEYGYGRDRAVATLSVLAQDAEVRLVLRHQALPALKAMVTAPLLDRYEARDAATALVKLGCSTEELGDVSLQQLVALWWCSRAWLLGAVDSPDAGYEEHEAQARAALAALPMSLPELVARVQSQPELHLGDWGSLATQLAEHVQEPDPEAEQRVPEPLPAAEAGDADDADR